MNQLLVIFTNYHDILLKLPICGHRNFLGTTRNVSKINKINVEIQILYLECQWKPHIGIILCNAGDVENIWILAINAYERLKGVHTLLAQSQLNVQNPRIKGARKGIQSEQIWADP